MNEFRMFARRSVCAAVWLIAAGLYGCGGAGTGQDNAAPDTGQSAPPPDTGQFTPAPDDYRHAHVLASGYGTSTYVPSPAALDLSHGSGPKQVKGARNTLESQDTHADDKPEGDVTYELSSIIAGLGSPDLSRGWTPQQLLAAYNVPATGDNTNKPAGYGIKVAIITAYHYSNLQQDLNKWAQHFGIQPITLNIVNQAGVITNGNMALTTATAVQMVNTVSPGATVYVIEAKSVSYTDIYTAIQTAINLGTNVMLLPFGADEFSTQSSKEHLFLNSHVVWIAPSGSDKSPSFPGTSSSVIAVGGTTLSSVAPLVETAWAESGAGMSTLTRMPAFQAIPSVQTANTTTNRSVPDVAFNADPEYGAHIYVSQYGGWFLVGGNTVSSAFFAGVVAIANQARKAQSKPMLTSAATDAKSLQSGLYKLMSTYGGPTNSTILHDVVQGYAGAGAYPTGPGYDIATGLGSLNVQKFIDYAAGQW